MGRAHSRARELPTLSPPLTSDDIISILRENFKTTLYPEATRYNIPYGNYGLVDYSEIKSFLKKYRVPSKNVPEDFIRKTTLWLKGNPALFVVTGSLKTFITDPPVYRSVCILVDNREAAWIINPVAKTIDFIHSSFRIDTVSV